MHLEPRVEMLPVVMDDLLSKMEMTFSSMTTAIDGMWTAVCAWVIVSNRLNELRRYGGLQHDARPVMGHRCSQRMTKVPSLVRGGR